MKRKYKTIREIKNKNRSDSFKEKVIGNYYKFKESEFECSVHFLSRFEQRKDEIINVDEITEILRKPINYSDIKNNKNVRYYDLIRVITNEKDTEIITVARNKIDVSARKIREGEWKK